MKNILRALVVFATILLSLDRSSMAATQTWTGSGTNWSGTAGDWSAAQPGAGDVAQFNSGFTNMPSANAPVTVGGIYATTGLAQNVTISGTVISLTGTQTIAGNANTAIDLDDTGNHSLTITAPVTTLNSTSFLVNNTGTLTLSTGTLTIGAGTTLTFGGTNSAGNIVVNSATAATTGKMAVNTSGTVTLAGANSNTGGFSLAGGTAVVTNNAGLGSTSGAIALSGGTLDLENGTNTSINAYNTTITGSVTIKSGGTAALGNQNLFGTLSIGGTLTATKGSNVTSNYRVQFGATTLTANTVLDAEQGTLLVVGAGGTTNGLAGNFNLTVQSQDGTGVTSIRGGVNGARSSGVTTFLSGNNTINGSVSQILGTTTTTLALNGGSLDLQVTVAIAAYNTTVGGNFTLTNNASLTQTLGTLSIGAYTLSTAGTGTTGTDNIGFGTTTFTGNATFNVNNGTTGATSTLTLGALTDGGTARTITKTGTSTLILGTASNLTAATDQINISAGTLSSTNATSLGSAAGSQVTVDVADGALFNVGVNQTIGDLTNTTGIHTSNTGSVTLGTNTLTIGSSTNLSGTFGGVISGTGAVTKAGTGTETLSGTNVYSGLTTVSAGTLILSGTNTSTGATTVTGGTLQLDSAGNGGLASGVLTLNGGTLQSLLASQGVSNATTLTTSATISGTNSIALNGALSQSAASTLTSSISGGTLTLGTVNIDAVTGTALTLTLSGTGNTTFGGAIQDYSGGVGSAHGALTITNTGTTTLAGANTYEGATSITGSSTVNLTGTIAGSSITVNNAGAAFSESSGATITGTGAFTLTNGTVTLSGTNSYTGATTITAGTMTITGTLGNTAVTENGGVLNLNNASAINQNTLKVAGGTLTENTTGAIGGTAALTVAGGTTNLSQANNYSGNTSLSSGTLLFNNAGAISTGTLVITGGTIDNTSGSPITNSNNNAVTLNGGTVTFTGSNALDLGTGSVTLLASSTISVASATNALTDDGAVSGAYTLTKTGTGTLILTSASTGISTVFTVSGGTLDLTGKISTSGAITINSGGIFDVSGPPPAQLNSTATVGVTINSGGELLLDDRGVGNEDTNRLADSTTITLNNRGTFLYEGTDDPGNSSSENIGALTLGSGVGTITVQFNNSNSASVKASSFSRTASTGGIALVNGTNLGLSTASSYGTLNVTTAPTLVGATAGGTTGINTGVDNTKIVPYLLGESGVGTGLNGTVTGTANTFVTYNSTTGFRPLNPTDEFKNNAIVAGDNTYITAATTSSGTASINSLVINGGNLSISGTTTLTDASGALLFVTNNTISGGNLAFGNGTAGSEEGIITSDAGVNSTISSTIVPTTSMVGLTVYGGLNSSLTLTGSNSYSGATTVASGVLIIGNNGALGGSYIQGAGTFKADNQARTLSNLWNVNGSSSLGGSNNLTFTPPASGPSAQFVINSVSLLNLSNTAVTSITGTFLLSSSTSIYNNNGEGAKLGSSADLVITGPMLDTSSGNVSSGNGSLFSITFVGVGGNLTLNPTAANNGWGGTLGNAFVVNNGTGNPDPNPYAYNTITVGGPGGSGATITPWGISNYYTNTFGAFLVAANSGQILTENIVQGNSTSGYGVGLAGTNSLTLSGSLQGGNNTYGFNFANIAAPSATLTLTGTTYDTGSGSIAFYGPGNTTFGSTSTLASPTGNFELVGTGTFTLSGTTTMTGSNVFQGGTVVLDYSASSAGGGSNRLAQGSAGGAGELSLSGVNLQLSGGSYTQTLGGTNGATINVGQSSISQTNSGSSTIALGAINRIANTGGVVNFQSGVATTTTANTAAGILGGYATVGGTDWAVSGSSGTNPITAYSSYTTLTNGTTTATSNYLFSGSGSLTTSSTAETVNSLKISATNNLALGANLTVTSGGLLFTGGSPVTISGNTLASGSGNDLIIQQFGAGNLTLSSTIGGGSNALTVAGTGAGAVILTGTNSYTGATYLDGPTLKISADNNLGSGGNIAFNGGTLDVTTAGYTTTRSISFAANGGTIEVDSGTLTASGVVSGGNSLGVGNPAGAFYKTGSGTLVLSGANTLLAPVTVSAGTLQLQSATALGASAVTSNRSVAPVLVNGGTLDIDGQTTALGNLTLQSGTIADSAGTGTLAAYSFNLQSGTVGAAMVDLIFPTNNLDNSIDLYKTTSGTVVLTGANTYSGATEISGGTLQIGNGGTTGQLGTANVTLSGSSVVAFDLSNTYSVSNAISGAGSLSQIGSGDTILTGVNSYNGGTTISSGTLTIASSSNLGSGLIGLATGATLQYTGTTSGTLTQGITVSSGTGTLSNTGGSTVTLSGTLTKANSVLVFSGGAFNVTGQITGGTAPSFNSDLVLNNAANVTLNNANDNYVGPTYIYGGSTLKDGVGTAPAGTVINLGNSGDGTVTNTFDLNGNNQTVAAINSFSNGGSTNANVITNSALSGTGTLTLSGTNGGGSAVSSAFGGSIQDGSTAHVALVISGGTHTFSGASTYTGGTTISSGTLVVTNASGSATGSGAFLLNSGGVLTGTGTIASSKNTLNGTVIPGTGPSDTTSVLTMTASGTTNFTSAHLSFNLATSGITPGTQSTFNTGPSTSIALGATPTILMAGSSLTLNLVGSNIVPDVTQYTLLTSSVTTGPQGAFTDLVLGTGNAITNVTLSFTNEPAVGFYSSRSYLELVNNGANGFSIDVEVIPEPGTWALMLGGLALLVIYQRARRNKNS